MADRVNRKRAHSTPTDNHTPPQIEETLARIEQKLDQILDKMQTTQQSTPVVSPGYSTRDSTPLNNPEVVYHEDNSATKRIQQKIEELEEQIEWDRRELAQIKSQKKRILGDLPHDQRSGVPQCAFCAQKSHYSDSCDKFPTARERARRLPRRLCPICLNPHSPKTRCPKAEIQCRYCSTKNDHHLSLCDVPDKQMPKIRRLEDKIDAQMKKLRAVQTQLEDECT